MSNYRLRVPLLAAERFTAEDTLPLQLLVGEDNFIPATSTRPALVYSHGTQSWLPLSNGVWVLLTENGVRLLEHDRFVTEYAPEPPAEESDPVLF